MDVKEDAVGGEEDDVGLERAELRAGVEGGGYGDDGALLAVVDDWRPVMGLLWGVSSGPTAGWGCLLTGGEGIWRG
jgi:hypothetical protein